MLCSALLFSVLSFPFLFFPVRLARAFSFPCLPSHDAPPIVVVSQTTVRRQLVHSHSSLNHSSSICLCFSRQTYKYLALKARNHRVVSYNGALHQDDTSLSRISRSLEWASLGTTLSGSRFLRRPEPRRHCSQQTVRMVMLSNKMAVVPLQVHLTGAGAGKALRSV